MKKSSLFLYFFKSSDGKTGKKTAGTDPEPIPADPDDNQRSSRKYETPRLAGGMFSRFLRTLVKISTMIVTI